MAKQRKSATETEALNLIGEVEGRDVLLVDDLTETAGTLTSADEDSEEERRARHLRRGRPRGPVRSRHRAVAKIPD